MYTPWLDQSETEEEPRTQADEEAGKLDYNTDFGLDFHLQIANAKLLKYMCF